MRNLLSANFTRYSSAVLGFLSRPQSCKKYFATLTRTSIPNGVVVSPAVQKALEEKSPVVALESAIITHGMQFPFNLQTALSLESIIKEEGALPATIGVINGKIHVGLSQDQIDFLSKCDTNCVKVSRRDLPYVLAQKYSGGTTVSGTMLIAHTVGIPLFVTGGIGGVHRGGQSTMDVSADLTELGRTPVTVVSAGVKSILDVGRTLEYLETQGVCVASVGESRAFPDFFTKDSGFEAPYRAESYRHAARMMLARRDLELESGILFAVPIPAHQEAEGRLIKEAIERALSEAEGSVRGRDVTPFVLKRVSEITEGKSLLTNMDLVKNNARYGARIAVEYSKLCGGRDSGERMAEEEGGSEPVVIGGSIVDMTVKIDEPEIEFTGRTHRGSLTQSYGGVGRNLADALTHLGSRPLFVSAVGNDAPSEALISYNPHLNTRGILRERALKTATYNVLLDTRGEALLGVGDMDAHQAISPQWVRKFEPDIEKAPLVILDGNVELVTMETIFEICRAKNVPLWYEPTDVLKAKKPWQLSTTVPLSYASPNLNEFNAIMNYLCKDKFDAIFPNDEHFLIQILDACNNYLPSLKGLMVTLGSKGFLLVRRSKPGQEDAPLLEDEREINTKEEDLIGLYFNRKENIPIVSVSGAGDCLASGFIAGMLRNKSASECASIGMSCAASSLRASEAVPRALNAIPETVLPPLPYQLIRL